MATRAGWNLRYVVAAFCSPDVKPKTMITRPEAPAAAGLGAQRPAGAGASGAAPARAGRAGPGRQPALGRWGVEVSGGAARPGQHQPGRHGSVAQTGTQCLLNQHSHWPFVTEKTFGQDSLLSRRVSVMHFGVRQISLSRNVLLCCMIEMHAGLLQAARWSTSINAHAAVDPAMWCMQGYRERVLACRPRLQFIDGAAVTPAERAALEAAREAAQAEAAAAAAPAAVTWPSGPVPALQQRAGPAHHVDLQAVLRIGAHAALYHAPCSQPCHVDFQPRSFHSPEAAGPDGPHTLEGRLVWVGALHAEPSGSWLSPAAATTPGCHRLLHMRFGLQCKCWAGPPAMSSPHAPR